MQVKPCLLQVSWKAVFLLELIKKLWIKSFSEGCGLIKTRKTSEPGQNCFRNG